MDDRPRPVPARLTVIILHYRGVEDTLACVRSVIRQCDDALDMLLVDNGSDDGIVEALFEQGLTVPMLRLARNEGWAGGNNAGIRWAKERGATLICLLNNDTVVPDGTLAALVETIGRIGDCLLHPAIDFADANEGAQLDPTLWRNARPVEGHATLYRMNYAYGACLVVPTALFDRIGLFDERFFLQLEESDFYERALDVGISAYCDVSVRIVHAESRSFGGRQTPDKTYYIVRNSLLLAAKRYRNFTLAKFLVKRAYWIVAGVAALGDHPTRVQMLRWIGSGQPHARATRQGIFDFCRGRFGRRRNG